MTEIEERAVVFSEITIPINREVRFCAHPTNDEGEDATIQGAIFCTIISGDGTYRVDQMDPLGIILVPGPTLSDTVYRVQGDSNPEAGVTRITEQITMHVISPNATKLNMKADPPTIRIVETPPAPLSESKTEPPPVESQKE